jgi:acyl-CoA thioesterase
MPSELPDALDDEPPGDFLADSEVGADPDVAGRYRADLSPAWNVFYVFGGMTLALALRSVERELGRSDLQPLTASALYVRPVTDGPVVIDVEVLRRGRSAAQATADLRNEHHDGPALRLNATFGQQHRSMVDFVDAVYPDVPPPENCDPPPPRPDDSPFADIPFHRQTDWRPVEPWDPDRWVSSKAEFCSWTRLVKEPFLADGTIDPVSLCVPADTLGPAISRRVAPDRPWFVLTLELSVHFLQRTDSPWILQHVVGSHAGDGYASGHVFLWDTERRLVGFAMQRARMRPVEPGEQLGPS